MKKKLDWEEMAISHLKLNKSYKIGCSICMRDRYLNLAVIDRCLEQPWQSEQVPSIHQDETAACTISLSTPIPHL